MFSHSSSSASFPLIILPSFPSSFSLKLALTRDADCRKLYDDDDDDDKDNDDDDDDDDEDNDDEDNDDDNDNESNKNFVLELWEMED